MTDRSSPDLFEAEVAAQLAAFQPIGGEIEVTPSALKLGMYILRGYFSAVFVCFLPTYSIYFFCASILCIQFFWGGLGGTHGRAGWDGLCRLPCDLVKINVMRKVGQSLCFGRAYCAVCAVFSSTVGSLVKM